MDRCCPHPPDEHDLITACQEVIHYPSEDYPCLCTGWVGTGEKCEQCGHARRSHTVTRVCRQCECRRAQ
jgi:hypothetical protein